MDKAIIFIKENNILYLIIGTFFSIFSLSQFNIGISIYIWPFCFLRYLHISESKMIPSLIVSLCILAANLIRWVNFAGMSIISDILFSLYFGALNLIPFLIDEFFYKKVKEWKSIFIFPLFMAFFDYISAFMPIANHNMYAYALRADIQYLQIISLFGGYFITFIIALFATILDYSIDFYKREKKISIFAYIYIALVIIIYFFGMIRLLVHIEGEKINISSVTGISQYPADNDFENEGFLNMSEYLDYINKTMKIAKDSYSQIINYAEEAFFIESKEDKEEIITKTCEYAKKYSIFVVLCLDYYGDEKGAINEALLISDEGEVLYDYHKQNLIPKMESEYYEDLEELKAIDTKYGRISIVICYDINFPNFINSLSRKHIDLLFAPAWDWDSIAEWHSNDARYRAIEGGFNLIKNTANGVIITTDDRGRALSYFIARDNEDYNVVSTVRIKGSKTLYSYIGEFINYFYLVALILVLILDKIIEWYKLKKLKRRQSDITYKKVQQQLNDLIIDENENI